MSRMSYVHKPGTEPLEWRTTAQIFDLQSDKHPEKEAFVFYDQNGQRSAHTFRQVQQRSLRIAASFLRMGWKPGVKIALLAPNGIEFALCFLALTRIGANAVLLPIGSRIETTTSTLKRLNCKALILSEDCEFLTQLVTEVGKMMAGSADDAEHSLANIILIGEADRRRDILETRVSYLSDLLKPSKELDVAEVMKIQDTLQFDSNVAVIFTSGSTGEPKSIQHTHHALVNNAIISAKCGFGIGTGDRDAETIQENPIKFGDNVDVRLFNDRPFHWGAGLMWGLMFVLSRGCTLVTLPAKTTVRDADTELVLRVFQDEKVTHAVLIPYLVTDITARGTASKFDLSSLKCGMVTGQLITQTMVSKFFAVLPNCTIASGYGMSEISPNGFQHFDKENPSSIQDGMVVPDNSEVKIINDQDRVVPVGTIGEICLRSPTAFLGYLEDREETLKTISPTGWLRTKDMGLINEKGRIQICGRKSDVISRAGVKIFPAEVEKVLCQHPQVKAVAVVGVPDQRLLEELCACVIPNETTKFSQQKFEEWQARQWSEDQQGLTLEPRYTLVMETFPKTTTGKLDRKALRAIAIEKLGLTAE